jgi:hypothetical protein
MIIDDMGIGYPIKGGGSNAPAAEIIVWERR